MSSESEEVTSEGDTYAQVEAATMLAESAKLREFALNMLRGLVDTKQSRGN